MFALNQGEVCTCLSRALIQKSIHGEFLERAIERAKKHVPGNALDPATTVGAQTSNDQLEKILSYLEIGKQEGAKMLLGGERAKLEGDLAGGYYVMPTVFAGQNKMRVFQEEIFGPVVSTTSFSDFDDAISIANDTLYGLGAGVWTRDANTAYRAGRAIQCWITISRLRTRRLARQHRRRAVLHGRRAIRSAARRALPGPFAGVRRLGARRPGTLIGLFAPFF